MWVFTARGRGVALARIVLQFVTYLHLHDKVGKPLRLLHIFPVSLIIALAQSLTAIPGGGPYTPWERSALSASFLQPGLCTALSVCSRWRTSLTFRPSTIWPLWPSSHQSHWAPRRTCRLSTDRSLTTPVKAVDDLPMKSLNWILLFSFLSMVLNSFCSSRLSRSFSSYLKSSLKSLLLK